MDACALFGSICLRFLTLQAPAQVAREGAALKASTCSTPSVSPAFPFSNLLATYLGWNAKDAGFKCSRLRSLHLKV
jgi:hypothetical protein